MRILMVGDVVGRPGRYFFAERTPELKHQLKLDVVVVNGENAAHGKGLTPNIFNELISGGADVVTTGNHIWDNPTVLQILDTEPFLLRPANYPEGAPGKGFCIYPVGKKKVGVINLSGRTFMQPIMDDPFRLGDKILSVIKKSCDVILVDFHAEAKNLPLRTTSTDKLQRLSVRIRTFRRRTKKFCQRAQLTLRIWEWSARRIPFWALKLSLW